MIIIDTHIRSLRIAQKDEKDIFPGPVDCTPKFCKYHYVRPEYEYETSSHRHFQPPPRMASDKDNGHTLCPTSTSNRVPPAKEDDDSIPGLQDPDAGKGQFCSNSTPDPDQATPKGNLDAHFSTVQARDSGALFSYALGCGVQATEHIPADDKEPTEASSSKRLCNREELATGKRPAPSIIEMLTDSKKQKKDPLVQTSAPPNQAGDTQRALLSTNKESSSLGHRPGFTEASQPLEGFPLRCPFCRAISWRKTKLSSGHLPLSLRKTNM